MKTRLISYNPRIGITGAIAAFWLLGIPSLWGGPVASNSVSATDAAATRADFQTSLALMAQGDDAGAISHITSHITWAPTSPGYEYHLGTELSTAAFMLYDGGNVAAARRIAALALTHLDGTGPVLSGGSAMLLAEADESAGLLEERIMGDLVKAQQLYARAISRDAHRPTAASGLARMNARLANGGH